jgi:CheY-like chemotaxis protein
MKKARILIIEDNEDNLELIRLLLERGGFEVLAASDGVEGLQVTQQEQPDLILLDLAMPEMDGWTVLDTLKADPETQGIPVVVVTAHAMLKDQLRAMAAGCDGYITKPIQAMTFADQVGSYLR